MTSSLIQALEGATGPDCNLDARVQYHVNVVKSDKWTERTWVKAAITERWNVPRFTSSVDAALALVPDGWWLTLDRYLVSDDHEPNPKTWRVWLKLLAGDVEGDGPCGVVKRFATGATPALALSAAALRSRAITEEMMDE